MIIVVQLNVDSTTRFTSAYIWVGVFIAQVSFPSDPDPLSACWHRRLRNSSSDGGVKIRLDVGQQSSDITNWLSYIQWQGHTHTPEMEIRWRKISGVNVFICVKRSVFLDVLIGWRIMGTVWEEGWKVRRCTDGIYSGDWREVYHTIGKIRQLTASRSETVTVSWSSSHELKVT